MFEDAFVLHFRSVDEVANIIIIHLGLSLFLVFVASGVYGQGFEKLSQDLWVSLLLRLLAMNKCRH